MEKGQQNRLKKWQDRMQRNLTAYQPILDEMDKMNSLYMGSRAIRPKVGTVVNGPVEAASMVRNIVAELVEAQVDSSIPMPKVTARNEVDEPLATTIEDFLRNETDRLPFEKMNDLDERTTPVQGGDFYLVEWDADRHTQTTMGELSVTLLHPKQVIPQAGVNEIEDMDYIFIRMAMTKDHVKEQYGIDVSAEGEESPESRGGSTTADDVVTVNFAYFRNKKGGIGRYVWVNDVELEYLEDYQARMLTRCSKCGEVMEGDTCEYCGSKKYERKAEDTFALFEDIERSDGSIIPAYTTEYQLPMEGMQEIIIDPFTGEAMEAIPEEVSVQTKIPYYKPDCYPIVLRRNVSSWGKVLGDSDVSKIQDQQNAIKKCDTRVQEKLDKGGSILIKSESTKLEQSDRQLKVVNVEKPSEANMVRVVNLQVDTSGDMAVAEQSYQAAQRLLGITDSYMGRQDRTATSGTAKQIAVAQSAGRLESKRIMKNAMFADLYQVMFKFLLAYTDEQRTVRHDKLDGTTEYSTFNKYDFLAQDDAGEWYWKDDFLFSVDTSSALASNREAMWQETRQNFQNGTFGDPTNIQTLLLFWSMMAKLHYPMAEETKKQLEEMQEQQMRQQMEMQQSMMQQQMNPAGMAPQPMQMEQPMGGVTGEM